MELTFLGTSAGAPTADRNVSGLALRVDGHWDLFDCGEGTQHRLLQTPLSLPKLRRVFVSHLHGDHCFGLFGVLGSRSMDRSPTELSIFGPPGLRNMIDVVLDASSTYLTYPIEVHEIGAEGGRVIDDDDMTVDALPLTHRVMSFAWSMHERDRPGRFDVEAARAAGVPDGPLFGQLQRGDEVELADGRRVDPADLSGPPRRGRRIVVAGDNSAPVELLDRTDGADVLVHEATYTEPVLATLDEDYGHSTAARVAIAAQDSGVRNLILTHFSPRFGPSGSSAALTIDDVGAEARQHFDGGLHLANDLDRIAISHDGTSIEAVT